MISRKHLHSNDYVASSSLNFDYFSLKNFSHTRVENNTQRKIKSILNPDEDNFDFEVNKIRKIIFFFLLSFFTLN